VQRQVIVVAIAAALGAAGCGYPFARQPARLAAPVPVTVPPDDADHLAWAADDAYFVVVRKACRTLDVYHYGQRVESFPAVFGLGGSGSKLYEGDLRTPTGLYMIVDKRRHARWDHFLLLDYPNLQDLHRYWLAMEAGTLPRRGDGYAGVGGAVGIHGTDKPGLNRRGVDWTWGCVSLANDSIERLARLVPVGTLVLIED